MPTIPPHIKEQPLCLCMRPRPIFVIFTVLFVRAVDFCHFGAKRADFCPDDRVEREARVELG